MSLTRQASLELDPQTIESCRQGDRRALELVFRTHGPALERQISRLVGPRADVEDLLQTTFIEAIGSFPRYRGEASVRTWLTRIAVNVVYQHLRRPERRRRVPLEVVPREEARADRTPVPERTADHRRRLERIYHHLDSISPKNRVAFVLHVLEGRSIEEVAAMVGAGVAATKSRVFLARVALLGKVRRDPSLRDTFSWEEP